MSIPFFAGVRGRTLVALLGMAAFSALLIGGLAYRNARTSLELSVQSHLNSIADLKEEQLERWLHDRRSDAQLLAVNSLNQEHFTIILNPQSDPALRDSLRSHLTDNLIGLQRAR